MAPPIASTGAMALARYGAAPATPAPAAKPASRAAAVAEEFEAAFLGAMFNQMFASLQGDGPLGGAGSAGMWRSFLADEYAKSFARAGGIGIGAQVYRTLLAQQEAGNR